LNSENNLKTIRYLTPDNVLFSHRGRLKIFILQLVARFLPGRFAIWLSLLDEEVLEQQVQIKFGIRSLIPGSSAYDVPRLHLIVERKDWLALHTDALLALEASPDHPQETPEQQGSGIALKPILDLLQRIDRDLIAVHGRFRINFLELDQTRTLTLALNDSSLSPSGSFFDVDVPRPTLDSILTGELDISSAFLRGRIRVGGDTGLAAKLVNALNPPATYPPSLDTPNAYVGLSDHPLDRNAINLDNVFDLFGVPPRSASCVLRVDLSERRDNSFIFRARGYDIYRNRRMEMDHTYVTDDEIPYTIMTWQLDFLRADVYRVRLAAGDCVSDKVTPMIASDITDPQLEVTLEEQPDHYLLRTRALCLKIYREDFRTEVMFSHWHHS
jgi:hypothetical protein